MACIWYLFPYYYFHSICLPHVWVGNGVVTRLFHFIACARLLCLGAKAFLWSQGISLSSTEFLFAGFCVTACCHFSFCQYYEAVVSFWWNEKEEGGRRRTKLSFGVGSFCSKFTSDWFCQLEKLNNSGYNLKLILLQIQCFMCINLVLCSAWWCYNSI